MDILNWLLTNNCILCETPCPHEECLCEACCAELPFIQGGCPRCGLPIIPHAQPVLCGQCLRKPPAFDRTVALFAYQPPITDLITSLKFHQRLLYGKLLGELLARRLQRVYQAQALPECVIPVPLHTTRIRERGYNQALEIAKPIARRLGITIDKKCCVRRRATQAQSLMPAKMRLHNVKNAFAVRDSCYRHVAIVDDVVTTGHTVDELSAQLKRAGVVKIDVWCIARTVA